MFSGKTYSPILKELYSLRRLGIRPALPPIRALLKVLGDPHQRCRFIHVAGTNGKGSTVAMISSILRHAGYKTGAFFSPHVTDFRERITLNGRNISKSDVTSLLRKMGKTWSDATAKNRRLPREITFFEWTTALAFCFFAEKKADIAVMETGMGGRLDATNVVDPLVSVITTISPEHTTFLGKTLASIASEKAGIIKRGRPVVCGETARAVKTVVREVCEKKRSGAYFLGEDFAVRNSGGFSCGHADTLMLEPGMAGRFQYRNAAVAAQAVLCARELKVKPEHIINGVKDARLPGRFEVKNGQGMMIYDVAHNPASIATLTHTLSEKFPGCKFDVIMGILRGKDYPRMLAKIAPFANRMLCITPADERAIPAAEVLAVALKLGIRAKEGENQESVKSFLAGKKKLLITGSFTTVEAVKKISGK